MNMCADNYDAKISATDTSWMQADARSSTVRPQPLKLRMYSAAFVRSLQTRSYITIARERERRGGKTRRANRTGRKYCYLH